MADAKMIAKLRQATGAGMMDCKKALDESGDDFDKAVDILRKAGAAKAAKKADRETNEGVVRIFTKEDNSKGIIVKVQCETDFVAKNEDFIESIDVFAKEAIDSNAQEIFTSIKDELVLKVGENIQFDGSETLESDFVLGYVHTNNKVGVLMAFEGSIDQALARDIAMHTVAMSPMCVSQDELDPAAIEKEKEIYTEQLKAEGKPENIIEKILEGKVNKFAQENCLLLQKFIKDEDKQIQDLLGEAKIKGFYLFKI